jgi:hypothetical protein
MSKARKVSTALKPSQSSFDRVAELARAMVNGPRAGGVAASDELRALAVIEDVPPGCALVQMQGRRHEPHVHDGEWVVIDTTAREIAFGELHLILHGNGPCLWQVNRITSAIFDAATKAKCAWLSPLNKATFQCDGPLHGANCHMSDGPIIIAELALDVLGRVVGILDPRARDDRRRAEAAERAREGGR